jgi:hypothetical protein
MDRLPPQVIRHSFPIGSLRAQRVAEGTKWLKMRKKFSQLERLSYVQNYSGLEAPSSENTRNGHKGASGG